MPIALGYALQLLTALPALVKAGVDITNLVTEERTKIQAMHDEKRDPTQAEWNELDAKIKALQAELHASG